MIPCAVPLHCRMVPIHYSNSGISGALGMEGRLRRYLNACLIQRVVLNWFKSKVTLEFKSKIYPITVIIGELYEMKVIFTWTPIVQKTGMEKIFKNMIHPFGLPVSLRMVCSAEIQTGIQRFLKGFPKIAGEDMVSITNNTGRNLMKSDDLSHINLC